MTVTGRCRHRRQISRQEEDSRHEAWSREGKESLGEGTQEPREDQTEGGEGFYESSVGIFVIERQTRTHMRWWCFRFCNLLHLFFSNGLSNRHESWRLSSSIPVTFFRFHERNFTLTMLTQRHTTCQSWSDDVYWLESPVSFCVMYYICSLSFFEGTIIERQACSYIITRSAIDRRSLSISFSFTTLFVIKSSGSATLSRRHYRKVLSFIKLDSLCYWHRELTKYTCLYDYDNYTHISTWYSHHWQSLWQLFLCFRCCSLILHCFYFQW